MIAKLVIRGLRRGKARFACAALGIAVATGTLVFMSSFVATNDAQAPIAAAKACAPWAGWRTEGIVIGMGRGGGKGRGGERGGGTGRPVVAPYQAHAALSLRALVTTVDYRPGGHIVQGPPLVAFIAEAPAANPYGAVKLVEGRWVNANASEPEVVCVKSAMMRFGKEPAPALGETVKFVAEKGTMSAKVVGYLGPVDAASSPRLPREFPYVFANKAAFAAFKGEKLGKVDFYKEENLGARAREVTSTTGGGLGDLGARAREVTSTTGGGLGDLGARAREVTSTTEGEILTPTSERVIASFKSDEQRKMDYARPLLMIAALLTALALLVNSLLLSIESNRGVLATLRVVGLTRGGVVRFVFAESLLSGAVGWVVGVAGAIGGLALFVAADPATFPMGVAVDGPKIVATLVGTPVVVVVAALFALAPALRVRGMHAAARRPRPRRRGMAITFALGFAAFVAVEVWGASLMRAFIPSVTWPDAIVSLLPGGVSSYDVEKLRDIPGVKRISELVPRQLAFSDAAHNALFMAAEFLPKFDFTEGDWATAEKKVMAGDGVVIAQMVANAHNLHLGDMLRVKRGGPNRSARETGRSPSSAHDAGRSPRSARDSRAQDLAFPIVGVVDLNWHMVTSRGLVRALNGAPKRSDGPVFCSLDTMGEIDPRTYMTMPGMSAPMTHLWVEYDPAFLAQHGVFETGRLIEAEIAKRLGNPPQATVRLHARDEIADGTLAHGTDVIGAAARVPFVFLAILAIGFVAMLVAETDARRREFVTLRAVGATRLQLAARLAKSAAMTALIGIVVALPLGTLAGWLTSFKTAALWVGLPHYLVIPWSVILEGGLGALVFALVVAVPTALILIRKETKRK